MHVLEEATLLRIFVGENDRHRDRPLYEAIVLQARDMHLAGATVLRGPMGFGHSSRLHSSKILPLSFDLPVVIEIVDKDESIERFLTALEGMIGDGLVTLEKVRVVVPLPAATSTAAAAAP
jgi:PII-like signaling protein